MWRIVFSRPGRGPGMAMRLVLLLQGIGESLALARWRLHDTVQQAGRPTDRQAGRR